MKALLADIGIDNLDSFSYEYAPFQLDFWDTEHKTCVEIDIYKSLDNAYTLHIIFCPDATGIVERISVFTTSWKQQQLKEETLMAKDICDKLIEKHNFEFSEEYNAYLLNSYENTQHALSKILDIIPNKKPEFTYNLKYVADDDDDDIPYEIGDNLDHFIAMMYMNDTPYIVEEVINDIEISIQIEGIEYLERLKNDIEAEPKRDFQKEYDLVPEKLEMIKETIRNYSPKTEH